VSDERTLLRPNAHELASGVLALQSTIHGAI
jgi:hypothetical protein